MLKDFEIIRLLSDQLKRSTLISFNLKIKTPTNKLSVRRLEIGFVLQVDSSTSDIKGTKPLSPNSVTLLDSVSGSSGSDISTDGSTTDGSDDLNISPKLNNIPTNG